jgi:hypothetical protein
MESPVFPNYLHSLCARCIDGTHDMPFLDGVPSWTGSVSKYELRTKADLLVDLPFCLAQTVLHHIEAVRAGVTSLISDNECSRLKHLYLQGTSLIEPTPPHFFVFVRP